ncbi:hypothetical protein A2767_04825 [Candidatus Roizmanbacteria bacterium RIFCSPHIGHO2_01_FULL_35_10]|uniref:Uncharacterized protein n=1 Tax=Candidatus Roizmanbacteria bacterium RIFCSPLOWO2_01_FULL_35_13 TaxID=1802055 RepID=A0A1F7IAA7_9BACT|nr:MAG: hypothetical protein A2767_04825 [Candidatus Roizmanbacteria bacterium RIFCSPHIGHO2_01_FULL_35_10]OGK40291.1 MAG: hypothetical protein A3A74_07340 [Candidatus Roizmanbacteria bacterium RIFCSPLOWO2_01_FULL_35_13]
MNKEKFDLLIVEYIWNSEDNDNRFVLTVFQDKNCQLQDKRKFIDLALDFFYQYSDCNNFIEKFDSEIIGQSHLFQSKPENINLSVFNYWLSVGPVELWQEGEEYNFEEIKNKIISRSEIEKTKLNYQGLLFRFNTKGNSEGPVYGLKTPCCDKKEGNWIINYQKVDYWIKTILK